MKNIKDVREELLKVFDELKSGELKPSVVSELNDVGEKIIDSLKVELEYYGMRKEEPDKVFDELKSGELKPSVVSEMSNAAGKIIDSLKVELEYYGMRKEKPDIKFFT